MQRQLSPSPQVRGELEARLAEVSPKRCPTFHWQYGVVAVCLLLTVAAIPLWRHFNPVLHTVVPGQGDSIPSYEEDSTLAPEGSGTSSLPKLNFWVTDPPSGSSSASYAAGEGVNRDALFSDLGTLLGGSIPEELGWEDLSDLTGYLAFGTPNGAAEHTQQPLDDLFYGHFYAQCSWGDLTLMVGGLGTTVSPDAIGRPEDYPGDAFTQVNGVEIRAARFTDLDGTSYGEVSFTLASGYSVFYSVNTSTPEQTEELLARLVQVAVVEDGLSPQALSPDPSSYESTFSETGDAAAPEPLGGVSHWQSQPWFGGYYYDNTAGRYVIVTVEGEPIPEMDFGDAFFVTGTYSYAHLTELMEQLNELAVRDPQCGPVMAVWSLNEIENRIDLTITEENSHLLATLAQLDPAGDAIWVTVGSAPSTDVGEDMATYDVLTDKEAEEGMPDDAQPGGQPTGDPIAVEPAAPEQSVPAATHFPEFPVSD